MHSWGLIPVILLALTFISGFVSTRLAFREIDEVNKEISPELHISYFFPHPAKIRHIKSMYRRLYPEGTLDRWRIFFQVLAFALFLLAAVTVH